MLLACGGLLAASVGALRMREAATSDARGEGDLPIFPYIREFRPLPAGVRLDEAVETPPPLSRAKATRRGGLPR
ncbi:hypothetical protein GCM10027427_17430 [Pseudoclavibacter terrae]